MQHFERILYEALLVAFGKTLATHDAFTHGAVLNEIGREIIDYLNRHGFGFAERGEVADLATLTEMFVAHGFASRLEARPSEHGTTYTWHDLYGREAYEELHAVSDNPFLACPLNLCLYYLADKHGKTMRLHSKHFPKGEGPVESEYEVVDKAPAPPGDLDQLVIENARLTRIAQERAERLEHALREIRTLRGIVPICMQCKKIRDDDGYWQRVETYLRARTDVEFSHGLCPDCETAALAAFAPDAE